MDSYIKWVYDIFLLYGAQTTKTKTGLTVTFNDTHNPGPDTRHWTINQLHLCWADIYPSITTEEER
jgi:hypothetical protein